jgi:hypothetical protein
MSWLHREWSGIKTLLTNPPSAEQEAYRGGILLLLCGVFWLPGIKTPPIIVILWVCSAWMIFPLGAWLGRRMPIWFKRRPWSHALLSGLLIGALTGFACVALFIVFWHSEDFIGLVRNRHIGAGYYSYRTSVLQNLQKSLVQYSRSIVPVTALSITLWGFWERWRNLSERSGLVESGGETAGPSPGIASHLFRVWFWVAIPMALCGSVFVMLESKHIFEGLRAAVVILGLAVVGPWGLPLYESNRERMMFAATSSAMVMPLAIASVIGCGLLRGQAGSGKSVLAWSSWATSILMWVSAGIISLLRAA